MAPEVASWNNWAENITWWTPPFEWGSDPQPILGECLLPPGASYPHTGIRQFMQTLVGVMVINGQCLSVLVPPPGLELLVDLLPGW